MSLPTDSDTDSDEYDFDIEIDGTNERVTVEAYNLAREIFVTEDLDERETRFVTRLIERFEAEEMAAVGDEHHNGDNDANENVNDYEELDITDAEDEAFDNEIPDSDDSADYET